MKTGCCCSWISMPYFPKTSRPSRTLCSIAFFGIGLSWVGEWVCSYLSTLVLSCLFSFSCGKHITLVAGTKKHQAVAVTHYSKPRGLSWVSLFCSHGSVHSLSLFLSLSISLHRSNGLKAALQRQRCVGELQKKSQMLGWKHAVKK